MTEANELTCARLRQLRGRRPEPIPGRGGSFDGGCRQSWPQQRSPHEAHNELIATMAQISRTFNARFSL
jgi:hypothetical protein